jgi:large repetitive protein
LPAVSNAVQRWGFVYFIYNGAAALNQGSLFGTGTTANTAAAAGDPGIGSSPAPYTTGATCPGEDTADVCGAFTLPATVSFTGPASAVYGKTFSVTATTNSGATAAISVTGGSCQVSVAAKPAATVVSVTEVSTPGESYGSGAHTTVVVALVWVANQAAAPTGGLTFTSTAGGSFLGSPNCVAGKGASIGCTQVFAPAAVEAPGTYAMSASYAGDGNYSASSSTQTNDFSITQQTPTVSVTSVAPAAEAYGSGAVVAVTASLGWSGTRAVPTSSAGTRLTFSSTAAGTFWPVTCEGPEPIVCRANFAPAATDAAGSYTFNASYAGDSNYTAVQSNSTANFAITSDTPVVSVTPNPATVSFGSTTAVHLTATFTGPGAKDAAPTGSVQFSAASGAFSGQSCSTGKDVLTCTVTYTPSGTLAVGTYSNYITASLAAGGDYQASSGSANLTVTQ